AGGDWEAPNASFSCQGARKDGRSASSKKPNPMTTNTHPASTPARGRGGRPPLADPRRYTLSTKLNKSELATVRARLVTSKLGQSEALRLLILNERLPEKVHAGLDITATQAYQNLQPLQSNLNQIAH